MRCANQTEKDPKDLTIPKEATATNAVEPSAMKKELTDDQLRAVAGGVGSSGGGAGKVSF